MFFRHEYDGKGSHRISWIPQRGAGRFGDWVGYQGIAHLSCAGRSAIAVTSYHAGGPLEENRVYFVAEQQIEAQ